MIVGRELDELELRAAIDDRVTGALLVADQLAERVLTLAADPFSVALASSYQELRADLRSLRAALKVAIAG